MRTLVGIGGSEDSLRALDVALSRAAAAGDSVTVAVVENPDSPLSVEEIESRVRERLRKVDLDDVGLCVLEGHAGSRLVDKADGEKYDRIVIGGGETSPMGKINIGSIGEFVLLNAKTSITLIR